MLEQGLFTLLQADPTLSALVAARIYPVLIPDGSPYPCLSYQVISGSADVAMDGSAELSRRIQFDGWGTSYADCKHIQKALHDLFDGFAGALSDGTQVKGAFRGIELDLFENVSRTYRSVTEYLFDYVE